MKLLRNLFVSIAAIWALLILAGCATDDGYTTNPGFGATNAGPVSPMPGGDEGTKSDVIRPQEKLTIEMLDIGVVQKLEQTVAEDGTITLPLLTNRVHAAGLKVGELQDAIRDLYVPKYYRRMTVSIKRENRFYFVRGQVKNPSQREWTGDIRVSGAISSAGDFTDYADKKNIEIIRGNGVKQKVNWKNVLKNPTKWDLPVYPGDTVHVPLSIY
jgi:protein involved in polysaccharide export with SLBB domain